MSAYTQAVAEEAARHIWTHWQSLTTLQALPDGCRPVTPAEGYAVQAQLPDVAGRTVWGWKIAATSAVGQAHIQVSGPLAGRLLSGQVLENGAEAPFRGNRMRVAEPEFAFRMRQDLPPRDAPYSQDEVLAAVGTLHPSLEMPDSRFETFTKAGEAQLIADNACARHFVFGPAAPDLWRGIDLRAHAVRGEVQTASGRRWTRDGRGEAVLGDPRIALTWLVNQLSSLGITLRAGQSVTTGTCMPPPRNRSGRRCNRQFRCARSGGAARQLDSLKPALTSCRKGAQKAKGRQRLCADGLETGPLGAGHSLT